MTFKQTISHWLLPTGFLILALISPGMIVVDLFFLPGRSGDWLDVASTTRMITAILVVVTFWLFTGALLIRRYQELIIRLFYVHGQVLALTMVYPLAHPSPWFDPPGLLKLSIAGFYFLAPLTLHLHITFPVKLGKSARRKWSLGLLYASTLICILMWLSGSLMFRKISELYTLLIFSLSIAVLIYAYLTRATPDERRRLRIIWFVPLSAMILVNSLYFVPGLYGWPVQLPVWLVGMLLLIVPVSYLSAITRQNLFGIDRFFNRTLVYIILTSGIFAVYLFPLIYLYNVLPGEWLVQALVSAALTLLIGWNFAWLRTRVERIVAHLFYGSWYDYPRVVESISAALSRCTERAHLSEVLSRQVPALMNLQPGYLLIGDSAEHQQETALMAQSFFYRFESEIPATWVVEPRRDGDQFTLNDHRIINTLGKQAEVALHNVLLIERLRSQLDEIQASRKALTQAQRQLLRSREEERARLARDLHDGPLQSLIGMNMQLGMLLAAITPANSEASTSRLTELRQEVRCLLDDLRAVCAELRPPMLDTLGLGAALRALGEEWSAQFGIEVELNLPTDSALRMLSDEVVVNLYRVVQETLTNIARHARASQVSLVLARDKNGIHLSIRDNGYGFSPPAALHDLIADNHFGLVGMQERVQLIGGKLNIASNPGQGTTVQINL